MGKNIFYKVLFALLILVVVIFFDTTLPIINGIIQLKVNLLGFFLEPLLQWGFDVSLRQAQIIAAWIYLLIAVIIVWYLLVKLFQALSATLYRARRSWSVLNKWQKTRTLFVFMLLFILTFKVALLFV